MITAVLGATPVSPVTRGRICSESAKIVGEIAARLVELETLRFCGGYDLVQRLAAMSQSSPRMFGLVCRILSGDTESVLSSYSVQAESRGKTKQAIHYEYHTDLARLARHFPEVAYAINEYRESIIHHEDPVSPAQCIRDARESER